MDDFTFYVGLTCNYPKRLAAHKNGRGSVHTKGKKIVREVSCVPIQVDNVWQARLMEKQFADIARGMYGKDMVKGGELSPKKVKEFRRKALIGK